MIVIDYLLIAIVALSAVLGIFRGFVKEAVSLLGWIFAIWGGWRFGAQVADWLPDLFGDGMARVWVGRLAILIGVLIISGIISGLISFVMGRSGLDGTDRFIGMIFGLGRGVILAGVVVSVLKFAGFQTDSWWGQSKLIPYAAPIAESLRDLADEGLELLQDRTGRIGATSLGMEG